jgi:hypothetical protein
LSPDFPPPASQTISGKTKLEMIAVFSLSTIPTFLEGFDLRRWYPKNEKLQIDF